MQFDENVDESVLQNLGDLSGLIRNTGYVQASAEAVNEGVNLTHAGEPGAQQLVGQPGNVPVMGNVQAQPGVTSGPGPSVDPNEAQRLREIAFTAARDKIEAQEALFEAEIAQRSEGEKEFLRMERRLDQTERVNNWLNDRLQGTQQMTEVQRQEIFKRQKAFVVSMQYGLPPNNETIRATLLTARNPQEMDARARELVQIIGQGQNNQARQQLNNGVFAAGGSRAGATGPNLQRFERSGDLTGLIENRGYTTVNWG